MATYARNDGLNRYVLSLLAACAFVAAQAETPEPQGERSEGGSGAQRVGEARGRQRA